MMIDALYQHYHYHHLQHHDHGQQPNEQLEETDGIHLVVVGRSNFEGK